MHTNTTLSRGGDSFCHSVRAALTLLLLLAAAVAAGRAGGPRAQGDDRDSATRLAPLTGQLRIGAEFFLNRTDTQESVRRHFRLMHKYGLTVARIFVIWDDIEREPDQWNFEHYDWIYDAAQESGIKIATTLCAEDPPGWMKLTSFYHHRMNLNDPKLRERAAIYIEKVVGRYRNHPAQGAWLLMNEPSLEISYDRWSMDAFGQWLQARYGSPDQLNKRWFRPVLNFSDVQLTPEQWEPGWADYYSFIDWKEFNIDNLCDDLRWIEKQVRALDPTHPTHINPSGLAGNLAADGQDPWKESSIVDFLGASIHPPWHFSDFERSEFGLPFAYCVDILRSAAGARPWWVTELQGGPTVYTGRRAMNLTQGEIRRWLWDAFGAGARGVVFWLWSPRVLGNEAGEWGLVSLEGEPSERVVAVKEVADALDRLPGLAQARAVTPKVAILYNRQTLLLIEMDGGTQANAHRAHEPIWSLEGTYAALHRAHIPVSFVDLQELKAGAAQRFDVLYTPYSYALDNQALEALREFVRKGGTLWADGLLAWKNEYGEIRPRIPGALGEVFGADAGEVYPVEKPYSVTAANDQAGELWRLPLELKGAEVLLKDRNGKPFAIRHQFGNGQAIYFATALTLGYFRRNNAQVQEWIVGPALKANASTPVQLEKGSGRISFRALETPAGAFAVLSNWGRDDNATVSFKGDYAEVVNALTGKAVKATPIGGRTTLTLPIPAGGVLVLEARKR